MKWLALPSIAIAALLSCAPEPRVAGIVDYPTDDASYTGADSLPRLVFADGDTSMNSRCMVRMSKLNRRIAPVFVNGRPVGFC